MGSSRLSSSGPLALSPLCDSSWYKHCFARWLCNGAVSSLLRGKIQRFARIALSHPQRGALPQPSARLRPGPPVGALTTGPARRQQRDRAPRVGKAAPLHPLLLRPARWLQGHRALALGPGPPRDQRNPQRNRRATDSEEGSSGLRWRED